MVKREAGFTLLETVVAMTVFMIFLAILFTLTSEMRGYEKRFPLAWQKHPQLIGVVARIRRDVQDSMGEYPGNFNSFENSDQVLIFKTLVNGGEQTIIWDFRTPGEAHRHAYNVGIDDEWVSRGLPPQFHFTIDAESTGAGAKWATRLTAKDQQGRIAIDILLQPRATD